MLWLLFLSIFILLGVLVWERILPNRHLIETLLIGSLFGMTLASILLFLFALLLPFQQAVFLVFGLSVIIAGTILWFSRRDWREKILQFQHSFRIDKDWLLLLITFILLSVFFILLFSRAIFFDQNGYLTTGFWKAYGDIPFHLMYITNFAWGENFPPQNPDFAGTISKYPFLPYLLSSCVISLGGSLIAGFLAPAFLLWIITIGLLIYVPWRISGNAWVAILTAVILFLSGGLGFWYFFQTHGFDILSATDKSGGGYLETATDLSKSGINLMNILLCSLLPQRGVLFGLPIFLAVIFLWFKASHRTIVASALLVGSLPLLHAHTFITLIIVLTFFLMLQLAKILKRYYSEVYPIPGVGEIRQESLLERLKIFYPWFWFSLIIAFSSLPAVLLFYLPDVDQSPTSFISFTFGWMNQKENLLWYWFKNLGVFLPILLLALISRLVPSDLKSWYLPFIPIFIIANIVLFSPWDFNNHKLFHLWYLVSAIPVSFFIVKLFAQKSLVLKALSVGLLFVIILSGGIDLVKIWHFSKPGFQLFSPEAQKLAEFARNITSTEAIFLTSGHYHSPILLSGRKQFRGHDGFLWGHGLDYVTRREQSSQIYQGSSMAESLIKKIGITHILIGPQERSAFSINEDFLRHYQKLYDKNGYQIFVVKIVD